MDASIAGLTISAEPSSADGEFPSDDTICIHGDDDVGSLIDVAPPIHVSTTFRYAGEPALLNPVTDESVRSSF